LKNSGFRSIGMTWVALLEILGIHTRAGLWRRHNFQYNRPQRESKKPEGGSFQPVRGLLTEKRTQMR